MTLEEIQKLNIQVCEKCGAKLRENEVKSGNCVKCFEIKSKYMIKQNIDLEIELTPKEIAESFWELDRDAQAAVFNYLAGFKDFDWQMKQVAVSKELNGGLKAMKAIGFSVLNVE